ncbi:MAG: hypothetical protein QOJ96_1334 [Alphaproteobacteria bacterium]|jgi:hypothetical protein|nr:hypothetical protein [Alphaproteobacteria bacterium]
MSILPSFLGFTLGAAIGTIATATTATELWDEASKWLEFRWKKVYSQRQTWRFPAMLSEALNLLQIEILIILLCIWVFGLLWAIFLTPTWDHQSHVQYIIGSLVGTAAAPWIWLHFSRSFETGRRSDGELARYRFVSYMLGAALLVALLQPYLATWLTRANKIEGFGVALNFTVPRNDRGANIPPAGQLSPGLETTTSRLARATSLAHLVATGQRPTGKAGVISKQKELADVTSNLDGFGDLSVMARDQVYIAYFFHERNARRGIPVPEADNLTDYIKIKDFRFKTTPDENFLKSFAPLSECISLYAESLRDFRLFLVDSHTLLRELLVDAATQWNEKKDKAGSPIGPSDKPQSGDSADFKLDLEKAKPLATEVVKALSNSHISTPACDNADKLIAGGKIDVKGIGITPYPAYLIAHYLAAIDSVESGILVLRDWLTFQRRQMELGTLSNEPEQAWYAVRAMLASSQLPYRFGSVSPTHRALVKFQQETTDRIAALLGGHDARTWRSLCERLNQRGLHAQIGRYLALTYADERNYLFELLRPEDFGLPAPGEPALISTNVSPVTYLEQAEAILESSQCFSGVPRFTKFNHQLIGLYSLNAAQLRYSVRASTEGDEKLAITRKIRADLERAKQLDTDQSKEDILDLLRQSDEFEPHRARLARFRRALDNESD